MKKKISLIWFLIVVTTLFHFPRVDAQTVGGDDKTVIEEANRLFKEGKYIEAFPKYSQLLSLHQKDPFYTFRFGVCMMYFDTRETAKPIEQIKKTKDKLSGADALEYYYFLGIALQQDYRFGDAATNFEEFIAKAGTNHPFYSDATQRKKMCESGLNLLKKMQSLYVLDKKQASQATFFRSYTLKGLGRNISQRPDFVSSKSDRKSDKSSLVYFSDTNKVLYYSSLGKKGENGLDIYRVFKKEDGSWSSPEILGPEINTPFDENYPFITPDGKNLYFCSKGHNSMGGYDIFRTSYDQEKKKWGSPENLDFPINSPFDDFMFVRDKSARFAIFASNRNSKNGQLFVFTVRIDKKFEFDQNYKMERLDAENIENSAGYDSLISMIKSASLMEVNANETEYIDTLETPIIAVSKKDMDKYKIPENPTEKQITDLAFEQVSKAEKNLGKFRNKRDAAQKLAEIKNTEAGKKNKEATSIYDQASYETDSKKKQELYSKATKLSAESEQLSAEALNIKKIFEALDSVSELQKTEIDRLQYKAGRVQQIAGQRQLDSSIVLLKNLIDNTDSFGIKLIESERRITGSEDLITGLNNDRDRLTQEIFDTEKNIKDFEEQAKQYKNEAALTNDPDLKKEYQDEAELILNKAQKEREKVARLRTDAQKTDRDINEVRKKSKSYENINKELEEILQNQEAIAINNDNKSGNNEAENKTSTSGNTTSGGKDNNKTIVQTNGKESGNSKTGELNSSKSSENITQNQNQNEKNPDSNSGITLTQSSDIKGNTSIISHDSINKTNEKIAELKTQYADYIKKTDADIEKTKLVNAYRFNLIKQKTELIVAKEKELSNIRKSDEEKQKTEALTKQLTEAGLQLDVLQKQQSEGENNIHVLETRKKTAENYMTLLNSKDILTYIIKSDSLAELAIENPDKTVNEIIANSISTLNDQLQKNESELTRNTESTTAYQKEYNELNRMSGKGNKKKQNETERKKEQTKQRLEELRNEKTFIIQETDSLRKLKQAEQKKSEFNIELREILNKTTNAELLSANEEYRKLSESKKENINQKATEASTHANKAITSEKTEWLSDNTETNQNSVPDNPNNNNLANNTETNTNPSKTFSEKNNFNLMLKSGSISIPTTQKINEPQRLIQQAAYYEQAANMMAIRASSIRKLAAEENRELSNSEKQEILALENLTKAYLQESSSMKEFAENQSKLTNESMPEINKEFTAKALANYQIEESKILFAKADSLKKISNTLPEGNKKSTILKEIEKTEELAWIRYFSSYDIYGAYNNTVYEAATNAAAISKIMNKEILSGDKADSLKAVDLMNEARKLRSEAFRTNENSQKANLIQKALANEKEAIEYMQKYGGGPEKVSQRNSEYVEYFEKETGIKLEEMVLNTAKGNGLLSDNRFYNSTPNILTENNKNVKQNNSANNSNNIANDDQKKQDNPQENLRNGSSSSKLISENNSKTIIAVNGSNNDIPFYNIKKPISINEKIGEELFYRIQFAASRTPVAEDKYKGISPIVAERSDGWVRYMAGYFSHFSDAIPSREAIKTKGFVDAFIVAYYRGKRISVFEARKLEETRDISTTNQTKVNNTITQNNSINTNGNIQLSSITGLTYSIQVGVYGKPRTSDRLFGISPLFEERMNNGYYRYYAGSFADMASVINERNRIRKIGIPDAFVVILYNGKKISQTEADQLISGGIKPEVSKSANDKQKTADTKEKPIFKIQIGAFTEEVPIKIVNAMIDMAGKDIERFSGENNKTIYLCGSYKAYAEAKNRKEELNKKGFPDAFIVAFVGGSKINLNEAIELSK